MVRIVKKAEERRTEIVKAARQLFQATSYEQTTMQDVVEQLGIAKGTVYYYFESKEALLEAVVEDLVDESTALMQKLVDESSGNALDKFRMIFSAGLAIDEPSTENTSEILGQIYRPGNIGMYTRIVLSALWKQAVVLARLIQQGCDEGLFQTDTPLETTEFITTAMQFMLDQALYPFTQEDVFRRAKALPTLIETLLKAQPGSFEFLTFFILQRQRLILEKYKGESL